MLCGALTTGFGCSHLDFGSCCIFLDGLWSLLFKIVYISGLAAGGCILPCKVAQGTWLCGCGNGWGQERKTGGRTGEGETASSSVGLDWGALIGMPGMCVCVQVVGASGAKNIKVAGLVMLCHHRYKVSCGLFVMLRSCHLLCVCVWTSACLSGCFQPKSTVFSGLADQQ